MYEIWRQTGRNGAPPEPEVVILKPEENYTHSSLGEHMLFEVAVYDAPVNLDCSSTCSLTQNASSNVLVHMDPTDACWRVVVFIWDTSSSVPGRVGASDVSDMRATRDWKDDSRTTPPPP